MPLYLVRWPGLEASIIRADDEKHLTDVVDEVASPSDVTWVEYDGPLWVDVSLAVESERPEPGAEWILRGMEHATAESLLGARAQAGESESADEMLVAVIERAFPNLSKLIGEMELGALDAERVRAAALRDLTDHRPSGAMPGSLEALAEARKGGNGNGGG